MQKEIVYYINVTCKKVQLPPPPPQRQQQLTCRVTVLFDTITIIIIIIMQTDHYTAYLVFTLKKT